MRVPGAFLTALMAFSFSIAVGLLLFIAGLFISLTVGGAGSIGLIFGIPLLAAGLVIPLFMMRDLFKTSEIREPVPSVARPSNFGRNLAAQMLRLSERD